MKGKDSAERAPQYVKDFQLAEWGHQALFYEYLEMVIQVSEAEIRHLGSLLLLS